MFTHCYEIKIINKQIEIINGMTIFVVGSFFIRCISCELFLKKFRIIILAHSLENQETACVYIHVIVLIIFILQFCNSNILSFIY